ncbi:MAG: efflux RND transporter periplasmic adaptor subunit [Clostridiaceae bacterium]
MNTVTPGTGRIVPKKKKKVKIIAICLIVALLAGGAYVFIRVRGSKSDGAVAQRTTRVIRGTLTDSIAGSAPIQSSNRSELSPKVTATLEQIKCKEGDQVKAGDVLFVLDNTDALLNIENAENSIDQMQLTLDSTAKSVSGLTVEAPYAGQVTNINVKLGDEVNKGGALLTITDVSKLNVTLPFSGQEVRNITVGQAAVVYLQDLMLSVNGTVTYKSSKPYSSASGGELYNVEITINNPGSLEEGMKATAEISAGSALLNSVSSGTISYINNKVIKSDAGGTVVGLNIRENEFVNTGDVLLKLENDDLLVTSSSNEMKMENLKAQLEIQKKQLTYYTITAPFDGTITKLGSANEGDTVKQGETLAVVSDMGHLEFSISIDELDISQIAAGQTVEITADAIEESAETPFAGKVSKVAMEGTSSNGVTTYPVTITVDDSAAGKLKTGMNIDAEIMINDKSDVLMVPVEAVTKMGDRSFVYVVGTDSTADQSGQSGLNNQSGSDSAVGSGGTAGANGEAAAPGGFNRAGRNSAGNSATGAGNGSVSGAGMTGGRPQGAQAQDSQTQSSQAQGAQAQDSQDQSVLSGSSTQNGASSPNTDVNKQQENSSSTNTAKSDINRMAQRTKADSYYAGATLVMVETGISNDTYIEIISGLTEGQEIVLPKTSTSTGTSSSSFSGKRDNIMGAGGIQGGGGMPSGGGPGGF